MKKATTLIILLALLFSLNIPINAEESKTTSIKDPKLADTLIQTFSKSELDILNDKTLYRENTPEIDFSKNPTVIIYDFVYWRLSHLPFDELLTQIGELDHMQYIVFAEQPIRLRRVVYYQEETTTIEVSPEPADLNFINDIKNMSSTIEILGQECEISRIVAFDGFLDHYGTAVYVDTDKGVFIKYYEYQNTDGVWFTEEDFQKYAKAYNEYCIFSAYNENGEPTAGCTTLLSFIELEYSDFIKTKHDIKAIEPNDEKNFSYLWIAIPVGVCAVLALLAAFIYRKPRLNKNFKYM